MFISDQAGQPVAGAGASSVVIVGKVHGGAERGDRLTCSIIETLLMAGYLFDAVSRNVSIGGLLLETASEIPRHSPVSFTMTVQGGRVIRPIRLAGEGEVVRVEPAGPGAGFAIALACKHPIVQMENYLPTDTL